LRLTPGTRLGVYEVTAPIGKGGWSQVHRATNTASDTQVAIKFLPGGFSSDPERLARFEREARTLAAANHPNIARTYAVEPYAGLYLLVMELVEGEDLSDRLARGPIPIAEAWLIAKQIAKAVAAAHEQGVIHGELTPANIKVRPDGSVTVLDFGLARPMRPSAVTPHGPVVYAGVVPYRADAEMDQRIGAYASPEGARGANVDRRTDIWAFGVIGFEMITHKRAFDGHGLADTLARILTEEPDWNAAPTTVAPGLVMLLRRCLEKDRKRRIPDGRDLVVALDGALGTAGL
jgi:serine/threonine protein kinase